MKINCGRTNTQNRKRHLRSSFNIVNKKAVAADNEVNKE